MSRLRVDLERLDTLVEQLRVVQEQLGRLHREADLRGRQLHLTWTGDAAAAQAGAHARWAAAAVEVQDALAALRAVAATAHGNYAAAAQANRRMWAL